MIVDPWDRARGRCREARGEGEDRAPVAAVRRVRDLTVEPREKDRVVHIGGHRLAAEVLAEDAMAHEHDGVRAVPSSSPGPPCTVRQM